ncbi:MAG: rubrerythrin family protein [Candidatus Diapherotrites archaeon]|nr:rubrerythrin family protein [Candidatus Diapherotrites archaeon]
MEKTIENLCKAFVGESQARNRYSFYAKIAKKEGFEQISEIFLLTAENEQEHAKWLFRLINELNKKSADPKPEIKIETGVPIALENTAENLKASIAGETHEYAEMYPEFADTADKEGLPDISRRLKAIAEAEKHHKERFSKLLKEIEGKTLFKKESTVSWVCRKCGYVHESETAPEKCPSCDHPQKYFEIKCEKY